MKTGLALSGGSALGNAHIGVLAAFAERNIPIDCIAGTSAGSVIAACWAFGVPMGEVAKATKGLNWLKISKPAYSTMGVASNRIIADFMDELIGKAARIENARIPLAIVATDIVTGEKVVFRSGSVIEAVAASTCIPGLFAPVVRDGRMLVDGGLVENLPVAELSGMGADVTIGVDLGRWRSYPKPTHAIGVVVNAVDIMVHYQGIAHGERADLVIEPHLEAFTPSDWKRSDALIKEGYRAAMDAMTHVEEVVRRARPAPRKAPWYARLWKKIAS